MTHLVEPYVLERSLPYWYVHTWDRTRDGQRSFRLDRMRSAQSTGETFEPREGFEPVRLRDARVARIVYSKDVARWEVERGAAAAHRRHGADGAEGRQPRVARRARSCASSARPWSSSRTDLRKLVAARAKTLLSSLGLARLRVPA